MEQQDTERVDGEVGQQPPVAPTHALASEQTPAPLPISTPSSTVTRNSAATRLIAGGVVILVIVLVLGTCAVSALSGGAEWLSGLFDPVIQEEPLVIPPLEFEEPEPEEVEATTLVQAKQALLQEAPHYYNWLADPDHPVESVGGSSTQYVWELLDGARTPEGDPVTLLLLVIDNQGTVLYIDTQ